MDKERAAAVLREAANRIEASEFDGDYMSVGINIHRIRSREQLTAALRIMDEGSVIQDKNRGTHWAKGKIDGASFHDCELTVFFEPELIGKVKKKVTTTTRIAMGTVADLLKGEPQ
jgi:hypothetical protein